MDMDIMKTLAGLAVVLIILVATGCASSKEWLSGLGKNPALHEAAIRAGVQTAVMAAYKDKEINTDRALILINGIESILVRTPEGGYNWDATKAAVIKYVPYEYTPVAMLALNIAASYVDQAVAENDIEQAERYIKAALDGARIGVQALDAR